MVCCGKQWDVLLSRDNEGEIMGALPFLSGRKFGIRYILQPVLTQYNGPWLRNPDQQGAHTVLNDLANQLESLHFPIYIQQFSPIITNWLPFYWKGYRQTTRYSYRIDLSQSPDQIFNAFSKKERQKVRRDDAKLTPTADISPEQFALFHMQHWQSHGQKDLFQEEFIERVCRTSVERGNGLIYGLRDDDNHLVVAWFLIYDDNCSYALMAAQDDNYPLNGATTCLVWHLLLEMRLRTKIFDFEGSMEPGVEQLNRSFGAVQTPYFMVSKFRTRCLKFFFH